MAAYRSVSRISHGNKVHGKCEDQERVLHKHARCQRKRAPFGVNIASRNTNDMHPEQLTVCSRTNATCKCSPHVEIITFFVERILFESIIIKLVS